MELSRLLHPAPVLTLGMGRKAVGPPQGGLERMLRGDQ
jgi:hypothetical protein